MGKFGEDLMKEREYRGVSLYKITQTTKISSRHLEALEQDRFDQLPGGVFNKGIVRGYARVVGLDEEAWVERYNSAYAASGMVKDDDADWVRFAQNIGESRPGEMIRPDMRLRWAGVGVLLMVLVCLGWFVWHFVDHRISAVNRVSNPEVGLLIQPPQSPCINAFISSVQLDLLPNEQLNFSLAQRSRLSA